MFVNPNRKYMIVGMTKDKKYKWTLSFGTSNRDKAYAYCDELNKNSTDGSIFVVNSIAKMRKESGV